MPQAPVVWGLVLFASLVLVTCLVDEPEDPAIWDFIVVGAGTGGSLCAGRLAASGASVLLLERGRWDDPDIYTIGEPRTVPGNYLAHPARLPNPLTVQNDPDKRQNILVGHMMGGTSAIHGDVYDRPPDKEFEYKGIKSWDEATIKGAFERIEQDLKLTFNGEEDLEKLPGPHHWVVSKLLGNLGIEHHPKPPAGTAKGGLTAGWLVYRTCPPGAHPQDPKCKRRTSYTDFVRERNNTKLTPTVLADAQVARVLLEGGEAVGVEILGAGRRHEAFARYAVVLAAGSLDTPKLLTLSGVGDPLELQRLGVPVRVANREVGHGLADHLALYSWLVVAGMETDAESCKRGEKFHVFYNSSGPPSGGDGSADTEIRWFSSCNEIRGTLDFGIEVVLLDPVSRGRVVVPSTRPKDPAAAEFPVLWEEDYNRLEAALAQLSEAMGTTPDNMADRGKTLGQFVRDSAYLYQHACCSARVAPEGEPGVCNERLQVRGVKGLYVADASAMPFLPSCHTSAAALLAGELASSFALEGYRMRRHHRLPERAWSTSKRTLSQLSTLQDAGRTPTLPPVVALRVAAGAEPVQMPVEGLGTGTLRAHHVSDAVATFLRLGGRLLDGAIMYDNLAAIQRGIQATVVDQSEIVITFKMMPFGRAAIHDYVSQTLATLGRKRLEIALLHWPGDVPGGKLLHGKPLPACVEEDGSWATCRYESYSALREEQVAGRVGAIGVSNFALRHLDELVMHGFDPPAVHQLELHPFWFEGDVIERAMSDGTIVQAYGCLGGAVTHAMLLRQEGFLRIANRHNLTVAQVLLKWPLQMGVAVIASASTEAHLEENLRVFDVTLEQRDMEFMASNDPEAMFKVYGPLPSLIP